MVPSSLVVASLSGGVAGCSGGCQLFRVEGQLNNSLRSGCSGGCVVVHRRAVPGNLVIAVREHSV